MQPSASGPRGKSPSPIIKALEGHPKTPVKNVKKQMPTVWAARTSLVDKLQASGAETTAAAAVGTADNSAVGSDRVAANQDKKECTERGFQG